MMTNDVFLIYLVRERVSLKMRCGYNFSPIRALVFNAGQLGANGKLLLRILLLFGDAEKKETICANDRVRV